jgi:glycosyltransferase involved in cell wall biosynthesis
MVKIKNNKIIIISGYDFPFIGAPWRRIEYFASFISKQMEVYVLGALSPSRNLSQVFRKAKGIVHDTFVILNLQWRINYSNWFIEIFNILGTIPALFASLVLRPKIVFVSLPHLEQLPTMYIAAKLMSARLIVDVRDPLEYWLNWTKGFTRKFFALIIMINFSIMRRADMVVAVSPSLVSLLAKQGVRARLVMNGADVRVFQPYPHHEARRKLGLSDDAVVLVFSGRLGGYYDATPLLQAVAKLPNVLKKKVVFLLVGGFGDVTYAKKFMQAAKELRLTNNIKVLQPIQDARTLAEILSAANVGTITHVTSELYDPAIPAKFYEYLACGLPVIALTRRGSELWRLIAKWKVGFACEQHDLDCITRTLEKIFDESIMESTRTNVLRVRPLIDRRRTAEKLYSLLCELLEPRRNA